ncbi:MAG: flagellar hook-associated protein FlgL [Firmicutes bacterium]|nr:flagellar hook-associated protein FlgL [Bacillota bacterium]
MRITNIMLTSNFLRNMYINLKRLEEAQDRLASGKEVRRPSDDPVRVVSSLALRSDLGEAQQYTRNIKDARTWMEVTEGALGNATEVLQRARELALYGASDTMPRESREALAREVEQLKKQLGLIANTTLGGRYIFGGTQTNKPPVGETYKDVWQEEAPEGYVYNDSWQGNDKLIEYEIAPNVVIPVNCSNAEKLFHGLEDKITGEVKPGAIAVLDKLAWFLGENRPGSEISQCIGEIDQVIDEILATRGELGARVNRAEMALDRLQQTEIKQTELLSLAEDADIAEAIMDLKSQENVYRVSLATGARIIMPTLVDFLR